MCTVKNSELISAIRLSSPETVEGLMLNLDPTVYDESLLGELWLALATPSIFSPFISSFSLFSGALFDFARSTTSILASLGGISSSW